MKAHAIPRVGATAEGLVGKVLCHDVKDREGRVVGRKGEPVDPALAERLLRVEWEEVHALELEPGDLHEEEAGGRLARAVTGPGVEVRGYTGGQWSLAAAHRGLLRVEGVRLSELNALEGISVFTLFDRQPVERGEVVARAKVTPLAIASAVLAEVEGLSGGPGVIRVEAFAARAIGAVARENLDDRQRQRFESALREKVEWFGSRLLPVRYAAGTPRAVAGELRALREAGADLLVVAGASALDPLDPVFRALELVGARMERRGAPAHPGSLLWLASWDGTVPVVGMPTCGMFSQATTFDLILPRILAGEALDRHAIAALGEGGVLSRETGFRFPPYRARGPRGELE